MQRSLSSGPQRRLLRHKRTSLWYKAPGQWTGKIDEALNFQDPASSVTECEKNALRDFQLILVFDGIPYGVGIDIHAGEGSLSA